jgi:anti-anti-sigma factor
VAVVECKGEHDIATRDQIRELFARLVAENDLVVIDVSAAQFLDSTFVLNLVTADRASRERGTSVCLQAGTEPIVRRMLEVSQILTLIEHARSREEALAKGASG